MLELPHTSGCLVCGRDNLHGLHLSLHVDPGSGVVRTVFTPKRQHIGFEGIVHGGVLATVLDEAMVWAAVWHLRRFCVCAEMSVRFRKPGEVGQSLRISARVVAGGGRLVHCESEVRDAADGVVVTAGGKYMPVSPEQHRRFIATMLKEPATAAALEVISSGPSP